MVRIFKHDTRINLRKRAVDAPLRLIRALYMENQNFFKPPTSKVTTSIYRQSKEYYDHDNQSCNLRRQDRKKSLA